MSKAMTLFYIIQLIIVLVCIDIQQAQRLNPIFDCDFDSGEEFCEIIQDPSPQDDFDWIYGTGPTEAPFTGPFADNTFRNASGRYFYIKSDGDLEDTVARIRIQPNKSITQGWTRLVFFYHMFDGRAPDRLGTLKVEACGYFLWSKMGNQSSDWLKAAMTFQCDQTRPEVVFEATRGGLDSDIAIDDIIIYDVHGDPYFTTEGTTTIIESTTMPTIDAVSEPVLTSSMLAVVIVLSVIGAIVLGCLVSTIIRKCMMK